MKLATLKELVVSMSLSEILQDEITPFPPALFFRF
jgi:hypothetical protein